MTSLPTSESLFTRAQAALAACEASPMTAGGAHAVRSPITGERLGAVDGVITSIDNAVDRASSAFAAWRNTPAPRRAEVIRHLAALLREHKEDLAAIVTIEAGKIHSEALGEVQEMIDICDFAVGLSRTMGGRTLSSERPGHRLMETWHPIGPVGIISAFNFPVAVWSWNAALAIVCGNPIIWKPSDLTPLTALASQALFERAVARADGPAHLSQVVLGDGSVGAALVAHSGVALISATGSTAMGAKVGPVVAARFGRSILE
ncbi:MAG TPA: aldehyde dehydrogenase family protein, partial [Ilumatobacteraceae bacterium]